MPDNPIIKKTSIIFNQILILICAIIGIIIINKVMVFMGIDISLYLNFLIWFVGLLILYTFLPISYDNFKI